MSATFDTGTSQLRTHWKGSPAIKHLFVFGDSYSSVGYDSKRPHPNPSEPLGVPFPGLSDDLYTETTWFEDGTKGWNWVAWFVGELYNGVQAYSYGDGGATILPNPMTPGILCVSQQIQGEFLPHVGKKPDWAPWSASDSLFVTWVGINDLGWFISGDLDSFIRKRLDSLFQLQTSLYDAGARNFLFIDVPPIHLSPNAEGDGAPYRLWNTTLAGYVAKFASGHDDATSMIFSSYRTFTNILTEPEKYGFKKDEAKKYAGEIWVDHIHPTSKVHSIVARDMATFLNA
ncbi:hypothetical protein EIP91_011325 [Steccherinum ochraceum]|uniref:SGNH hydrolase-type esterase domain-containing protein n=1 Tax=Steccherinum ochraceum TaxID=92696 RepID=A0A4R0QZT7_9APHY|nr:hypothetical protein EIP91_011325 [Steccherinum ochraceum]